MSSGPNATKGRAIPGSYVLVHGSVFRGFFSPTHQRFKMLDRLRGKEGVGTHIANVRGYVLEYKDIAPAFDRVDDELWFILPRAPLDTTFHRRFPLSNGVSHLGDVGSYTVIIMATSRDVVQQT